MLRTGVKSQKAANVDALQLEAARCRASRLGLNCEARNNNNIYYYYHFFAHWYFIPRRLEINKV